MPLSGDPGDLAKDRTAQYTYRGKRLHAIV